MGVVLVVSLMDALLDFPSQKPICNLNLTEGIRCYGLRVSLYSLLISIVVYLPSSICMIY